jgi:pimeloyl-ACP methyl ester carboxylesterase
MQGNLPGSVTQMERDAATFFDIDIPALFTWTYTAADAALIAAPVLYVGGSDSGRWFAEVRELLLSWLPRPEDVVIGGADHSLAISHPARCDRLEPGRLYGPPPHTPRKVVCVIGGESRQEAAPA